MSPALIPPPVPRRRLLSAALGVALLVPTAATAADAPVRTIARDGNETVTAGLSPIAVSGDGRQVIANLGDDAVVRDVVEGTTRRLVPSGPATAITASTDLRVVLLESASDLTPSDTNGTTDYYALDRATGVLRFVSDVPARFRDGQVAPDARFLRSPSISGDGNVIQFVGTVTGGKPLAQPGTSTFTVESTLWRVDLSAGGAPVRARELTGFNGREFTIVHADQAGAVGVTNDGVVVGDRVFPLPAVDNGAFRSLRVAVSTDGRAVAVADAYDPGTVKLLSTTTGTVTSIPMPSWLVSAGYRLLNAYASGVAVSARFTRAGGEREAVGYVTTKGAVTQVGGDIPASTPDRALALSANLSFAATNQYLAQLGTRTLPGTEPASQPFPTPPPPPAPTLITWMPFTDVSCSTVISTTWSRASVSLTASPVPGDPRTPASATVKVTKLGSPSTVYNAFTLKAGASRELTVPRTGAWTYAATITFTDGSKYAGSVEVPAHPQPPCTIVGLF